MGLELLTSKNTIELYKHLTEHPKQSFSDKDRMKRISFEIWDWYPEIDCHKVLSHRLSREYDVVEE